MEIRKSPPLMRDPADEPRIETPVIQIQDLEYQPGPDTRMNDSGVRVLPQIDLSKEDDEAREAIAKLEEQFNRLPAE
jgi:hypothetical protein